MYAAMDYIRIQFKLLQETVTRKVIIHYAPTKTFMAKDAPQTPYLVGDIDT